MGKYEQILSDCENLIKVGQVEFAQRTLKRVNPRNVPRKLLAKYAQQSRRAGLYYKGLSFVSDTAIKALQRSDVSINETDLHHERAEYGALLVRIGATSQAEKILNQVDYNLAPEALFFKGFCKFATWENEGAAQCFKEFLALNQDPSRVSAGKLNLIAALVESTIVDTKVSNETEMLVDDFIDHLKSIENKRLLANAYEIKAQLEIKKQQFDHANDSLYQARKYTRDGSPNSIHFIEKWSSISQALQFKNEKVLVNLKMKSQKLGFWETSRECDLYLNLIKFDESRFHHLYFGTPYPAYRKRIKTLLETEVQLRDQYRYGYKRGPLIDLRSFCKDNVPILKSASQPHQIIDHLLQDFYKPSPITDLFNTLFPDQYFDYRNSKNKIHKAIERTRVEILDSNLPIEIEEHNSAYRLKIIGPLGILIHAERKLVSADEVRIELLKQNFKDGKLFHAKEVTPILGLKKISALKLLNQQVAKGELLKIGVGPNTKYAWK